jgi:probable phosphoglycerate mutase
MDEVWLVRHGETEWSRSGQHTSVTDLPLTATGEAKAKQLAGYLRPEDFGLVLSSPRQRARRTAELAGFTGAHQPQLDLDLSEWAYGEYEGLTSDQIHRQVPGWTIWTHPTPGGESADQVAQRLDRVVHRLRNSQAQRAVCFGHGHALRALTMRWLGFDLSYGVQFPLDTGTVSVLGAEKGRPALVRWNAPV